MKNAGSNRRRRRRCTEVSADGIMVYRHNAPAQIPQVPSNARRQSAFSLSRLYSGIVCIEGVRGREGWMDCHRPNWTRGSGKRRREETGGKRKQDRPESSKENTRGDEETTRGHGEARTIERTDQPWAWLIITFMTGHLVHSEP